jgi:ABC-type Mn2+/Zn2+ transport system permease subunit
VTFGFLVVPPFTARLITRRMLTFSLISAGLGAMTAFAGFYCAYRFDLPLGPAEVVLASLVLVAVWTVNRVHHLIGRWLAT